MDGAGWESVFVAKMRLRSRGLHGHLSRRAQGQRHGVPAPSRGLLRTLGCGVATKRLITDNGSAFRSRELRVWCSELGIVQRYTRAYRPWPNGMAESFEGDQA